MTGKEKLVKDMDSVGRLQCPEVCPKHKVHCQRIMPHKPVKLRKPEPRILMPADEHSHMTGTAQFCKFGPNIEPHDPFPDQPKIAEVEPTPEGQLTLFAATQPKNGAE